MINLNGKVGACGYIPIWLQPIHPIQLVKTDQVTGEILRHKATGFAIKCEDGEPGQLIGKIMDGVPMARYDGYTDKVATEKKIARNVFKEGDKYYMTGDCMMRDKYGYFYFQDRLGDTFRWKSENVATTMNNVVYGVKVPGTEGSACMASILDVYDGEIEINRLADGLKQSLPKYAMPMFIRMVNNERGLDMTGTFKVQKMRMKKEGFNIEMMDDPVFVYSTFTKSYRRLDLETYKEIMKGNYRF
ncbi:Long-chain fatty acid transport protein 4 [Orchesella cincta]|uniref:Long-chain fatty acid transport protein 4 n=1 Tax=Orchesella cincta TaxID=48709 RepID=A0A1D2MJT4_ORCCI|nr:Long-chain fatty acid transport protein 4 [Orchesella cincta]